MPAGGADAAHEGTTKTGAPKEHFGSAHEARVEAGKKGGHISVRPRALHGFSSNSCTSGRRRGHWVIASRQSCSCMHGMHAHM